MPTISQLPTASAASASDLIPISQSGSAHAISVGDLLAQTQPAINIASPSLLGRISIGPGGPDSIAIGGGLVLANGTLTSMGFDPGALPSQTGLPAGTQFIVANQGSVEVIGLNETRALFTAGSNISIDSSGTISCSATLGGAALSVAALPTVPALASGDLVAVSQGGTNHSISYQNLIDGVTIDQAQTAGGATDGDTFWVAQSGNVMLRQTLGAIWSWVLTKLPLWKRPVLEISVSVTLDGAAHNQALLICSSPVSISAPTAGLGSGFCCEIINASTGTVILSTNIVASNGSGALLPNQCCSIYCATYSGRTTVFGSVGLGSTPVTVPGQVSGLTATSLNTTSVGLSWSAPVTGGTATTYSVQYRVTGTTSWLSGGQNILATAFTVSGLLGGTSYDFVVLAANNAGNGPASATLTVTTPATVSVPGAPTGVILSNITTTGITCTWTAPTVGGTGMVYSVQYRVSGQSTWLSAVTNLSSTTFNLTNLTASTSYDVQIVASNSAGSGSPSAIVTATTAATAGLVSSITWNVPPSGTFVHGTGSVGVNAHVTPGTSAIRFGFSTSTTTQPSSWTTAVNVNTDLWGAYVPTPATAGSWYGWAEGTDGSAATVYPTPITVT